MKAERLNDGRVRLEIGNWSDVFTEDRRAPWIAFYRRMFEDYGVTTYKKAADALEALADQ